MPLKKDTRDAGLGEERRLVFHCIPFCVFWEKILNYVYALSFWLKRKYVGGRGSLKKIPRFYLASQVLLLPCLCGQVGVQFQSSHYQLWDLGGTVLMSLNFSHLQSVKSNVYFSGLLWGLNSIWIYVKHLALLQHVIGSLEWKWFLLILCTYS